MKATLNLTTIVVLAGLCACQKTINWEGVVLPGSGGGSPGSLLAKRQWVSATDSAVETYSYDASKKMVAQNLYRKDKLSGNVSDFRRYFSRDAQGRISIIRDSVSTPGGAWDTFRVVLNYSGATSTLLYSIASWGPSRDSIVFSYTGSRIGKVTRFNYNNLTSAYEIFEESVFVYDGGGNMTRVKEYDVSGTAPVMMVERMYLYDNKVSPFQMGNEAILLTLASGVKSSLLEEAAGSNNYLKVDINDPGAAALESYTLVYNYRSNNTPNTATYTYKEGAVTVGTGTMTFYYL